MTEEEKKAKLIKWESEIHHFTPEEFDSVDLPGSGIEMMNLEFVKLLDQGRASTKFPWFINSGYRSLTHNIVVGGVDNSDHTEGNGVDIAADAQEAFQIVKWALSVGIKRIGLGKGFVHIGFSFNLPQEVFWGYYK